MVYMTEFSFSLQRIAIKVLCSPSSFRTLCSLSLLHSYYPENFLDCHTGLDILLGISFLIDIFSISLLPLMFQVNENFSNFKTFFIILLAILRSFKSENTFPSTLQRNFLCDNLMFMFCFSVLSLNNFLVV